METLAEEVVLATFQLAKMHMALDTAQIREAIILDQEIVPLPSGVDFVEGVMDLRGTIVPLVNLKKRLHRPDTGYAADCRAAIVALQDLTLGILFDGVKDVIRVRRDSVVRLHDALQGEDTLISGVVNHTETGRIIEIIDPVMLVSPRYRDCFGAATDPPAGAGVEIPGADGARQIVVFSYGGQEYGVAIDFVREVETVQAVDTAFKGDYIDGAVRVHGSILPLIRLESLGQSPRVTGAADRGRFATPGDVVVIAIDDVSFVVAIDQVREMIAIRDSQISWVTLGDGLDPICFALLDAGRSIQIIDAQTAFRFHLQEVRALNNLCRPDSACDGDLPGGSVSRASGLDASYLIFEAGRLFAVEASAVQEILPTAELIAPLSLHAHLEGILNLRQTALPVFDLALFLGLPRSSNRTADTQRIVVVKAEGETVVLQVDRVSKLTSQLRETSLPPLGETLSKKKALFKSMLVADGDADGEHHVLRLDTGALIEMLTTPETGRIERE